MRSRITRHHIIPKSAWWNRHFHNIEPLREVKHRALHTMFENKLPAEQISEIVDLTWKAFNKVFAESIIEVVNSFTPEEIYNQKCANMDKLIKFINESKNDK